MTIRVDNLHINNYKIFQDSDAFCFGTDAVLLAWFAGKKKFKYAADLCSGNGIVPILLSTHSCGVKIHGFDILSSQCELAKKSADFNGLNEKLDFFCLDIRDKNSLHAKKSLSYDLVTANPPYMTENSGFVCEGVRGSARTELTCKLNDVIFAANLLLKNGGRFCMVNKPDRLTDIFVLMRSFKIEPKRLCFVSPREGKKPILCLVEGIKQGKSGLICEPNLVIYDKNGEYTSELKNIYGYNITNI